METSERRTTPIYPLISFRIIFGLLMLFSTLRFMALGWIEDHYIDTQFHFHYFGFEWIEPLGRSAIYFIHGLMVLAALFVCIGLWYHWSALILFLSFTYVELIDLTYYLNHYYFVSLVCFALIFLPANRAFSVDVQLGRVKFCNQVPPWTINCLLLLISIVYLYAGLAKVNTAWLLEAMPLKLWLPAHNKMPILGPIFDWEITPYLFSWFGMIYDTFIVVLLLLPATRSIAYVFVVVFHLMTGLLFQIGVFPIVMIGVTTLFFSAQWHKNQLLRLSKVISPSQYNLLKREEVYPLSYSIIQSKLATVALVLFFGFQLLFPWRYLLYPGNLFWTEEGYRFSWRVMLMEKSGSATFYVKDSKTQREGRVVNTRFLNDHQIKQMAMQPDMILQFAHFLGAYYAAQGVHQPQVRAEVYVTLNGQPSRKLIDDQLDLMQIQDSWQPKDWILPLD